MKYLHDFMINNITLESICKAKFTFWNPELQFVEKAMDKNSVILQHNMVNYELILRQITPGLGYSTFHCGRFLNGEAITDDSKLAIKRELIKFYNGDRIIDGDFENALTLVCKANSYNPIANYLDALPETNTHYLDTYLTEVCAVEDMPLVRKLGRKWLISAVARAIAPGCDIEGSLIFYGEQGIGKSRFFKELNIKEEYYHGSDVDFSNVKDTAVSLQGSHIAELAELASLKKSTLESVKAFLTCKSDIYVPKYSREKANIKRSFVFGGSTNAFDILSDSQNRRFWCVKSVAEVDFNQLHKVKAALWREAYDAFNAGESWFLNREEKAELEKHNQQFKQDDPMKDYMICALADRTEPLSSDEANKIAQRFDVKVHSRKVSSLLIELGWVRKQITFGERKGCMEYVAPIPGAKAATIKRPKTVEAQAITDSVIGEIFGAELN